MTITCPACSASYRISPETLREGRTVRCGRCRAEWTATHDASTPDDAIAAIPALDEAVEIDMIDRSADRTLDGVALRAKRPDGAARRGGKSLAAPFRAVRRAFSPRPIAVVAGLAIAACGFLVGERVAVVRAAPSLASLYEAFGLPVNVRGLAIGDVRSVEMLENGAPLLLVTGQIENVSQAERAAPRLRLAVAARDGRELYAWTTMATRATLAPGESAPFRARLASPPAEGAQIVVRFVSAGDQTSIARR